MFLLLPLLDEFAAGGDCGWPPLPHPDAGRRRPTSSTSPSSGCLALPAMRSRRSTCVLRSLASRPVDAAAISAWSNDVTPDGSSRFTAVAAGLQPLGKVFGGVIAPMSDGVVAVDNERGIWLGSAPSAVVDRRAARVADDLAGHPGRGRGDRAWIEALSTPREPVPRTIDAICSRTCRPSAPARSSARRSISRRHRALPPPRRASHRARARVAASGFPRSTLPYLAANFLAFHATVHTSRIGTSSRANPPLHLVLSLTGMNRRRFVLRPRELANGC